MQREPSKTFCHVTPFHLNTWQRDSSLLLKVLTVCGVVWQSAVVKAVGFLAGKGDVCFMILIFWPEGIAKAGTQYANAAPLRLRLTCDIRRSNQVPSVLIHDCVYCLWRSLQLPRLFPLYLASLSFSKTNEKHNRS